MSIRALNQNLPSLDSDANAKEQGPSRPFFPAHGAGDHSYPNPWSVKPGNGDVGHPGHPYPSPWTQGEDEGQGNEANDETGGLTTSRGPYPYPGPAEGHPPYTFPGPFEGRNPYPFPGYAQQPHTYPGPLPWHQPHAYPGPEDGRKPYPSPWEEDDKHRPSAPRQPYQLPGGSHNAAPFPQQPYKYPGNPHSATNFPNSYPLPGSQHGGHGKGWGGDILFGKSPFGGPSSDRHGRWGLGVPHRSQGPWPSSQQAPFAFPSTGSDKYKPEVDVFDTPERFLIHMPLPGAKKEDIEVNWDPKAVELSITGLIGRPGSEDLVKRIALDERKVGAFERKVRLGDPVNPPKVDADAISAKLEDGVLVVEVPKTEPDDVEVKKVEVE